MIFMNVSLDPDNLQLDDLGHFAILSKVFDGRDALP